MLTTGLCHSGQEAGGQASDTRGGLAARGKAPWDCMKSVRHVAFLSDSLPGHSFSLSHTWPGWPRPEDTIGSAISLFSVVVGIPQTCSHFLLSNDLVASWVECYSYFSSLINILEPDWKSGVFMSNGFVIFQSSVMYIKCNIGMQTQNVIHFNSLSDMVQVSSFLKVHNHVWEVYAFISK